MGMQGSNSDFDDVDEVINFEDGTVEPLSQSDLERKQAAKRKDPVGSDVQDVRHFKEKTVEEVKALALLEAEAARKIDFSQPLFKKVELPDGRIEMVADLSDFVRAAKKTQLCRAR